MANGVIGLTSTSSKLEGRIVWESTSNGATANNSNVVGSIQVRRNDGYTTKGTWSGALTIHETTENFSNSSTSVGSDWVTMKQFTVYNVPHKTDGSGACWISGWCNAPSGTSLAGQSVEGSSTVTLDKIARYLSITSFEIRNITINTAQVFWSTDVPRNDTHYYLNNNATGVGSATYGETVANDQKSGSFYVKGLSPNTQCSIKISCTRTDNGLVTTTSNKTFSTYNIATINTAPNFNIGQNPTITWTNPGGCKTVVYSENIVNGKIESTLTGGVDVSGKTSYTYLLNASTLYSKVPNSNSGTIRYVIKSSNDGKDYYNAVNRTYYVTNSNPTFSNFTFKDTNSKTTALTGNNQKFIKGYSSLQAIVSTANKAVAKNSATMKNYTLTVGTKNSGEVAYSSSADVNLSVSAIDNNVVFVTAKDSRQNTTAVQKTISDANYYTYTDLTITKCTLTRSDGGVGTQVTLNYEGAIWNKSFGSVTNAIVSIKYEYKIAGTSTWTTGTTKLTPTVSGSKYSQTILIQGDLAGSGFNDQNSYDFRLTVSDKLSTTQFTLTFGAGTPLVAYHKNGMAIKGKYDTSAGGALQVYDGDVWVRGKTADKDVRVRAKRTDKNVEVWLGVGSSGTNHGVFSIPLNKWLIYSDGTNVYLNGYSSNVLLKATGYDANIFATSIPQETTIREYIKETSNRPENIAQWGSVITVPAMTYGYSHQIAIGNFSSVSRMAIRSYVAGQTATGWEYLASRPTILYMNWSGSTGTVTLSANVDNYEHITIFYRDYDYNYMSVDATGANKNIVLIGGYMDSSNPQTGNFKFDIHKIGTNTISPVRATQIYFDTSTARATEIGAAKFSIIKVIGYK